MRGSVKYLYIALLTLLVFSGCGSKDIESTLLCNERYEDTAQLYSTTLKIDSTNQKVYIKDTIQNLDFSRKKNQQLREAELYSLIQEEYEFDERTRSFIEIGNKIRWREKAGTWTLNLDTLVVITEGYDGNNQHTFDCRKLKI